MIQLLKFLFLIQIAWSLQRSGIYNTFYWIPYSIGERQREWDSKDVILNDEPTLIAWGYNFNIDYKGNLWFTDSKTSQIFYISKEKKDFNAIFFIAG